MKILGGDASDSFVLGGRQLNIDTDTTKEVTLARFLSVVELHGGGGEGNFLSAQGDENSGPYSGVTRIYAGDRGDVIRGSDAADEIYGGAGADFISGFLGADVMHGGGANDDLRGGGGNDTMNGDGGSDTLLGGHDVDTMNGGEGDDTLDARRSPEVVEDLDGTLDGGPGTDTAYVDPGEGHKAVNVETLIGDDPAPPPPPNDCDYEPVSEQITVALDPGGQATFKVVGTAIQLGDSACGAATTTTTSRIVVTAAAGGVERVEVDQRGGAFAPGHVDEAVNPEPTDQTLRAPTLSEIEFFVDLGNDPGDTIAVRGAAGDDLLAAGSRASSGTGTATRTSSSRQLSGTAPASSSCTARAAGTRSTPEAPPAPAAASPAKRASSPATSATRSEAATGTTSSSAARASTPSMPARATT